MSRSSLPLHRAVNGRYYVRLPNGQTRFISDEEAEQLVAEADEILPPAPRTKDTPSTRRRRAPAAHVAVRGHFELDFNERQVGWILRGFIETARNKRDDVARLFGTDERAASERREHSLLLELGEELFQHMPAALTYFDVTSDEWAAWYRGRQQAQPLQQQKPTTSWLGQPEVSPSAWLPPVVGRISARFGDIREDGKPHAGIDIAVPTGTPVVASQTLKVRETGFSERSGRYVVADVIRPDGSFGGDGYRLTFAHLSEVTVADGQVVHRGHAVGASGATGRVTGPHLHFRVQWVDDGLFRDKLLSVDPLGLIPEAVFLGVGQPQPIVGGAVSALEGDKPINVIVAPGAGRVSIGSGMTQPDIKTRVNSPNINFGVRHEDRGDPLAGIVTLAAETVRNLVTPESVRAVGALAGAGGAITAAVAPQTAPVSLPVAAAGGAVAAAAEPIANVANAGADFAEDLDPLEGII